MTGPLAPALPPGTEVDGFRVEAHEHSGGSADLYRVVAPGARTPLLMKVPRVAHGEPALNVIAFETEATLLGALRGPHVPRLVAAGDVTRRPYLVMERVAGTPLERRLAAAPLPPGEVAAVGAAIATALHDLHLQDAVHLDVTPSNVLLRPDGAAVLVDFGIAWHAHYPDLLAEELRHPVGSAPYLSPEQAVGVRGDPRSDLFALGVVLYQLATGRLPFGAPATRAGLRRRLYRDPVPPRALVPATPEWLQEVVLRCLEPDPDARYATAAHLAFDLSHPEDVVRTARARRLRRDRPGAVLRRWLRAGAQGPPAGPPSAQVSRAPLVLVAVAAHRPDADRFEELRREVRRLVADAPDARVACVVVIPPTPALGGPGAGSTAGRRRIEHLAVLGQFAEPLRPVAPRVSLHVLESSDPAEAIVAYARANGVDHLVVGAPPAAAPPGASAGAVSLRVAASAPCTVTVVRPAR